MSIKTLITMITPNPDVKAVLSELEPHADIRFLGQNENVADHLHDLEVLYGTLEEQDFEKARKLRWVQTNSTGVEQMMYPAFQRSDVILTSAGNAITTIVAEHALAVLFALARNLHLQRDLMREHTWKIVRGREIGNMTLGILGFGKIGSAIATRARPSVKAINVLDLRAVPAGEGIDKTYTPEQLHEFLGDCDAVICSLPLTPQTRKLIAGNELKAMRSDSLLINISRGEIVNETAMLDALRNGDIGAAGIDVLENEPCPPGSPLWDEPRLLLTPHSAGYCENLAIRKMTQFVENFRHYIREGRIPGSIDKLRGW